jgi:hypothetical protein
VPLSFPTTSPVAVATARILSAYLSNHKLSPAEAAGLGERIADALGSVANGAVTKRHPPAALAPEPAPWRQARPRLARQARAIAAEAPPEPERVARVSEPVAEREPEAEPVAPPQPVQELEPSAQAETIEAANLPRKRKRPSRPRSRRGGGASAMPASEVSPGEGADDDESLDAASDSREIAALPAIDESPEAATEPAAEHTAVVAKPRRTAGRARRIAVP